MTAAPAVSIVVPARGRPDHLSTLIASMRRLDPVPGGFEVVIVDDGSPQPLEPAARAASGDLDLTVIRTANGGPGQARNAGIAQARGGLVAFTDDDCVLDRRWLAALAEAHAAHPRALLGGGNVTGLDGNPWAEATQALEDAVYARANRDPQNATFFAGKNLAAARADLLSARGFDAHFRVSEDRELCTRWRSLGRPLVYVPEAVVAHSNPHSARVFWRQHFGYGRGAFHFHRLTREGGGQGLRPDPADYAGFVREPLFGPSRGGVPRTVVLALVIASQAASAVGYMVEAACSREGGDRAAVPAGHSGETPDGSSAPRPGGRARPTSGAPA